MWEQLSIEELFTPVGEENGWYTAAAGGSDNDAVAEGICSLCRDEMKGTKIEMLCMKSDNPAFFKHRALTYFVCSNVRDRFDDFFPPRFFVAEKDAELVEEVAQFLELNAQNIRDRASLRKVLDACQKDVISKRDLPKDPFDFYISAAGRGEAFIGGDVGKYREEFRERYNMSVEEANEKRLQLEVAVKMMSVRLCEEEELAVLRKVADESSKEYSRELLEECVAKLFGLEKDETVDIANVVYLAVNEKKLLRKIRFEPWHDLDEKYFPEYHI